VIGAFAGDVDYAAAAFQRCENDRETKDMKKSPLKAIERIVADFYEAKIFKHPSFKKGDLGFSLLLGIRLKSGRAKFYRTTANVMREVKTFDCAGTGEDAARDLLQRLYAPNMTMTRAVSLASYVIHHVKEHVQYCGGHSDIVTLEHGNDPKGIYSPECDQLARHIEESACWFICEAQQFMLGHTLGDRAAFEERFQILKTRALRIRDRWDSRQSARSRHQETTDDPLSLPAWPE